MDTGKKSKLERMEKRLSQLTARVQLAQNRKTRTEKNRETRRRLLAGDYLYRLLGSDWQRVGKRLNDAAMLKPADVKLFEVQQPATAKHQPTNMDSEA